MNKKIYLLIIAATFFSCSKQSKLQKDFLCKNTSFSNIETVEDFKGKFSIDIPKHWKTQLYFDDIQTQIITADTTKNFTNTYAINTEYNSGNLIINDAFTTKIKEELDNNNLHILKEQIDIFKEKKCYWTVSQGKKTKYDYYFFELFVKSNKKNYLRITTDIYGSENIDDRFCESLSIIETLKILN